MTRYSPVCSMLRCSSAISSRKRPPTRRSTSALALTTGVIHCPISEGTVQASKIWSAAAPTVLRTYARRGSVATICSCFQVLDQGIDPPLPEPLIQANPRVRGRERFGPEREPVVATGDSALDQAGALQHLDVLGDGVQRDLERMREVGHLELTLSREPPDNGSPGWVSQRVVDAVELQSLNHIVEHCSAGPPWRTCDNEASTSRVNSSRGEACGEHSGRIDAQASALMFIDGGQGPLSINIRA